MKRLLLFIIPIALVLFSCHKDSPKYLTPGGEGFPTPPSLSVSPMHIDTTAEKFQETLTIHATDQWEIINIPEWITVDPTSGTDTASVSIDVKANTEEEGRVGTFRVATEQDTITVAVSQGLKENISKSELDFTFKGDAQTIHVVSAGDWEFSNVPDWITIDPKKGSGVTDVNIAVDKNMDTANSRSAVIKLDLNGKTKNISVTQNKNTDHISAHEFNFGYNDQTAQTIELTTGGDWEFTNIPDWVTLSATSGTGNSEVTIEANENLNTTDRADTLHLDLDGLSMKVAVNQTLNPALNLSGDITLAQEGKYLFTPDAQTQNPYVQVDAADVPSFSAGQSFSISMKMRYNGAAGQSTTEPRLFSIKGTTGKIEVYLDRVSSAQTIGHVVWLLTDQNGTVLRDDNDKSTTKVEDGDWHHIVLVYNADEKSSSIYIDGKQESVVAFNGQDVGGFDLDGNLFIANDRNTAPSWAFGDKMDDVRMWKKALTKKEIYADAANIVLDSDQSSLIANWEFDVEDNDMVKDKVSQIQGKLGNSATIQE